MGIIILPTRKKLTTAYSPLTAITGWVHAYWAEDPLWTPPSSGSDVTSWRNAGSDGGNATNIITGTSIPEYFSSVAALNNKPAIRFYSTANNGLRNTAGSSPTRPFTVVAIVDIQTGGTNRTFVDSASVAQRGQMMGGSTYGFTVRDGGTQAVVVAGGSMPAGLAIMITEFNGASTKARLNRTEYAVTTGTGTLAGGISIGIAANTGGPFDGHMPFVGRINRALTTTERSQLEDWSLAYYGV